MSSKSIKIILLGDTGVGMYLSINSNFIKKGKTALASQFIEHTFPVEHIETLEEIFSTSIRVDGELCYLQIIDTSGAKEYKTLRDEHIMNADAILLVYDCTEPIKVLGNICLLYREVSEAHKSNLPPMILVGNKIDLPKKMISKEDGELFAKNLNVPFFETSAKLRKGVDEVFTEAARLVLKRDPEMITKNRKRMSLNNMKRISIKGIKDLKKRLSLKIQ